LEHRLKPLHSDLGVPKHTLEVRIEGTQVEQRFVDVEDKYAFHDFSGEGGVGVHDIVDRCLGT
jgi:hypothetical protein